MVHKQTRFERFQSFKPPALPEVLDCRQTSKVTVASHKISVDTYWTNLPESPDMIIKLYHDHATSEQFHSEIKTDLDAERLPSGEFATNKLILRLIAVAYNILRRISSDIVPYCGTKVKRKKIKRRRIRSVLLDLVYTAFQWIEKGGRWIARFGRDSPFYTGLCALYSAYSQ